MKEATGELNMTVITVIAIAAVAALFYAFVWPMIQKTIVQQTCNTYGAGYTATKSTGSTCNTSSDKTSCWVCKCTDSNKCTTDIIVDDVKNTGGNTGGGQ